MMTGNDILAMDDRRMESVLVPEWNDAQIFIRTMGGVERSKYEATLIGSKDEELGDKMARVKVMLVVLCACNEAGERLFTDDQFDEVANKNGEAINRLFDVINRVNLVSDTEVEEEAGN